MKNHTAFCSNFKPCQHFIGEYRMIPYKMNIEQSKDVSSKRHAVPGQTEPRMRMKHMRMTHDESNHLGDCNQMASGPQGGRSEPQIDCLLITRHFSFSHQLNI